MAVVLAPSKQISLNELPEEIRTSANHESHVTVFLGSLLEHYRLTSRERNQASWKSRLYFARPVRRFEQWCAKYGIPEVVGSRLIRAVTKEWLIPQDMTYNKLIVERGTTDTRDPRFNTRNRFIISARRQIRAFVEDDPNKAKRLCDACEVVFLIDQPYNQFEAAFVPPKNLIDFRTINIAYSAVTSRKGGSWNSD